MEFCLVCSFSVQIFYLNYDSAIVYLVYFIIILLFNYNHDRRHFFTIYKLMQSTQDADLVQVINRAGLLTFHIFCGCYIDNWISLHTALLMIQMLLLCCYTVFGTVMLLCCCYVNFINQNWISLIRVYSFSYCCYVDHLISIDRVIFIFSCCCYILMLLCCCYADFTNQIWISLTRVYGFSYCCFVDHLTSVDVFFFVFLCCCYLDHLTTKDRAIFSYSCI